MGRTYPGRNFSRVGIFAVSGENFQGGEPVRGDFPPVSVAHNLRFKCKISDRGVASCQKFWRGWEGGGQDVHANTPPSPQSIIPSGFPHFFKMFVSLIY